MLQIPRAEKIKKTAEIMCSGLQNLSKKIGATPKQIQILIEPHGNNQEPKYRLMKELKDIGDPKDGKPTVRHCTFREILGHIDFTGYSLIAGGFFSEAFRQYAISLNQAGKQCTPNDVSFMVTSGNEEGTLPFMHLYVGMECIQMITFDDIFPPEKK